PLRQSAVRDGKTPFPSHGPVPSSRKGVAGSTAKAGFSRRIPGSPGIHARAERPGSTAARFALGAQRSRRLFQQAQHGGHRSLPSVLGDQLKEAVLPHQLALPAEPMEIDADLRYAELQPYRQAAKVPGHGFLRGPASGQENADLAERAGYAGAVAQFFLD